MSKMFFTAVCTFLILLHVGIRHGYSQKPISGKVYEDINGNGLLDHNEPGVPGVAVSNQREVVLTDENGHYKLPVREPMILFISKPSGFRLPVNVQQLPQFFYIHHPEGSPQNLKYAGVAPTGDLPTQIHFPLYRDRVQMKFNALLVGDPQPRDSTEVGYYRDDIVSEMIGADARFYLALGDIAFDHLDTYEQYNRTVSQIGIPAFNVHGNHDMNFKAPNDTFAAETFRRVFGPEYYSFNYGQVHFVVLDNVQYLGWNKEENRPGRYRGYLSEDQLTWLKNDLKFVPQDRLIVLSMHIPIFTHHSDSKGVNVVNRDALFDILENRERLLALSAHIHTMEMFYFSEDNGWHGGGDFFSLNPGAGCGAWWSGPKDARGIPETYCMDGSPNGYFLFTFDGAQFNYSFKPAYINNNKQMNITNPRGIINKKAADTTQIIVNIYAADMETEVFYQIDDGQRKALKRANRVDPFVVRYLNEHADSFPGWINTPASSYHIWTAPLPADLKAGTHTIKVSARDHQNKIYSGVRIFEIAER